MSSHSWLDVWKLFLDLLSRENTAVQIAIGLGAAFVAVMALEGIRASFFPKRILESAALRGAAPPPPPALSVVPQEQGEDMRAAAWNPAPEVEPIFYTPLPPATVNTGFARRSGPAQLRIIGARKPS